MRTKDYYKILDVGHSATQQDVKKAYRRLAMRYHPDKNNGNQHAAAYFTEIKEAYQVLSDPARRSAYNQQRWYRQSTRSETDSEPLTPYIILKKSLDLDRYISTLDPSGINERSLSQYIMHLLEENSMKQLLEWNDISTNHQVIATLLKASQPLSSRYLEEIGQRLVVLAGSDNKTISTIRTAIKERKRLSYWQKYQALIILILTLLLCYFIFIVSN